VANAKSTPIQLAVPADDAVIQGQVPMVGKTWVVFNITVDNTAGYTCLPAWKVASGRWYPHTPDPATSSAVVLSANTKYGNLRYTCPSPEGTQACVMVRTAGAGGENTDDLIEYETGA